MLDISREEPCAYNFFAEYSYNCSHLLLVILLTLVIHILSIYLFVEMQPTLLF